MSADVVRAIPTFCHIPKTAGSTFDYFLRSQYGLRHINVLHLDTTLVPTKTELVVALKVCPWARSIAGHGLYPNLDYPVGDRRLVWYTFLRDPVARYVSHYQYQLESGSTRLDFEEWVATGQLPDMQVRHLAGGPDLDLAIRIVDGFAAVGLVEDFDASLLVFADRLGLPVSSYPHIRRKKVHKEPETRKLLNEQAARFDDGIRANNRLDLELYGHVRTKLWPRQVADYGAARLAEDRSVFARGRKGYSLGERVNVAVNLAFRTLVYKPIVAVAYRA